MAKTLNLNGIRSKAILCRIKVMGELVYTVMRPITEEQEKEIDDNECLELNGNVIPKDKIYCYGEFNVNSEEDLKIIERFNIINMDSSNLVYSNFDFDTGEVTFEGRVPLVYDCYTPIKWFKHNFTLIGKPNRIIIYKCKKRDLC